MTASALSPESVRMLRRLRDDRLLFLKRLYKIQTKPPHLRLIPLVPNLAQRMVIEAEQRSITATGRVRVYVLKGRQGGITTWEQAVSLHEIWRRRGASCITVSHTREHMDKIFEITTRALRHFPPELLPRRPTAPGSHEVEFIDHDSRLWTETAGEEGRTLVGLTLLRAHASEWALWRNPVDSLTKLEPTLEAPGTAIVLETTASGFQSEAHKYWTRSEKGLTGYIPLFIAWWYCDLQNYRVEVEEPERILDTLTERERDLMQPGPWRTHGLDLEQIAWRRAEIDKKGESEFLQQYPEDPETCWLVGGRPYYDVETLRWLLEHVPEPVRTDEEGVRYYRAWRERPAEMLPTPPEPWRLKTLRDVTGSSKAEWEEELQRQGRPKPQRAIIGADTAEGGAEDRSAFVARRHGDWSLLADYADDRIQPRDFARLLAKVGRGLDMALIVVEKNFHGITVLRHLIDDEHYPRAFIYHRAPIETDRGFTDTTSTRLGWYTSEQSKPLMLEEARLLFVGARRGEMGAPSRGVVMDAFSVHRDEHGKIDLNGRDLLVGDMLAALGRDYPVPFAGQSDQFIVGL